MHVQQLTVVVLLIFAATLPRGTQAQIRWVVVMEKGIKDNDISCNQQTADNKQASTCRVCGGVGAVAAACEQNSKCDGFEMENWQCGYLKSKAHRSVLYSRVNTFAFCKYDPSTGFNSGCTGDYMMWVGYDRGSEWDWDCGAKEEGAALKECRSKGTALSLMSVCQKWAKCDGFAVEMSNNDFGILKRSDGKIKSLSKRDGWLWFARIEDKNSNKGRKLLGTH